jgi:putative flippase GtrA
MTATGMKQDDRPGVLIGQIGRFVISGGLATALNVAVYWVVAVPLRVEPLLANLLGYLAAMVSGYVLHSRWSFKGHGRRDDPVRTTSRFFIVSLVSLGLNSLWVWLLTDFFALAPSWPIIPMLVVTPLVTFALNRRWVFA